MIEHTPSSAKELAVAVHDAALDSLTNANYVEALASQFAQLSDQHSSLSNKVKTLVANINNDRLSDEDFRQFVKNTFTGE